MYRRSLRTYGNGSAAATPPSASCGWQRRRRRERRRLPGHRAPPARRRDHREGTPRGAHGSLLQHRRLRAQVPGRPRPHRPGLVARPRPRRSGTALSDGIAAGVWAAASPGRRPPAHPGTPRGTPRLQELPPTAMVFTTATTSSCRRQPRHHDPSTAQALEEPATDEQPLPAPRAPRHAAPRGAAPRPRTPRR
jgi:hypothetical protein